MPVTEQFIIRSDTGDICLGAALDREITDYHELVIAATDRGGLSATSIVHVFVIDVNDNRPIFHPREYNITIRTDGPISGPIVKCVASDADAGIFGQINYRISEDNGAELFRIDRNTGEIYVVRENQLTKSSLYLLNIVATDAAGLKSNNDAIIRIIVTSSSQKIASCDRPKYSISIKENVAQNTFIGSVRDPNILTNTATSSSSSSSNLTNTFYWVTDQPELSLEVSTGAIRTKLPLDRETRDRYILNVEVRNGISVGYCQVEIIVEDVNDNSPVFASDIIGISVAESHPIQTSLYVAHAIDRDITPVKPIRFGLSQNSNEIFEINAESGEVYPLRPLDYETQQRHRLVINAFDGGGLSTNFSINIDIQDVNDNPPIFERNEYYVEITENAKLGMQIIQVTAVDLDTGNNAQLSYRLEENINLFRMNTNTGWISLAGQLDREHLERYNVTILASDNGSPVATASTTLVINILDENDNEPHFHSEFYHFELLENLSPDVIIGTVCAVDADIGSNAVIRYTIVQPTSSFIIDPNTGELRALETLDREIKAVHELIVEARDQGTPSRASRIPVKVTVLDVNDNSPEIVDPQGDVVSVREEQMPNTEVARVRAFDNDLGENATITYSILKDHDSDGYNVFRIDPISGMIKTMVVLDHEERNVYRLSVKASDGGRPSRYSVRAFRVEVLALTDNRPTFTSGSLSFKVREDANIGQVVGSVSGGGVANRVAYTLYSLRPLGQGDLVAFDVDRFSGQLVVATSLDREIVAEYQLEIRALDTSSVGNPQSMAVSVRIEIEDANDNPPRWPQDPIFIEVSEHALVGSNIYNFTATDLDQGANGEVHYSLVSEIPPTGSFAIDPLTGGLTLVHPLDREERSEFTLVLEAKDQAQLDERLTATVSVRLLVLDVNDNEPYFVVPDDPKVPLLLTTDVSPGALLLQAIAIDEDMGENGRVSYTITSAKDVSYVAVDSKNGELTLLKPLHQSSIDIELTASDHGSPPRSTTVKLTLRTTSQQPQNQLPRLLLPKLMIQVSENLHVGSDLINVAAATLADQGNMTFSIIDDSVLHIFEITNNGMVRLIAPLNREEKAYYLVGILARFGKLLDLTTLEIIVLDENDNSPEFKSGSCYTLTLPENQETAVIHTIAATDLDEGKNGEIFYNIINGNVDLKFKLDSKTGALSVSSLDREIVSKYVLTVSARDGGRPTLETFCNLTIIVLDVNDNAPVFVDNQYSQLKLPDSRYGITFTQGKYSTSVSEDVSIESSIMQVQAIDSDYGVNSQITYSIADELNGLFRIDNFTGIITTAGVLDREWQKFHTFVVVATDGGKNEVHQTSVSVNIEISDVNDNYPVFDEYPFIVRVPTSTQSGHNIVRVKASDLDEGKNGDITYRFSHEEDKPKFRIHPSSGIISAAVSLAQEDGRIYWLEVIATDKGNPSLSSRGLVELCVGNLADAAPILKFQNDSYDIVIQENSRSGTELIQVTAVRSDGRRQQIIYSIGSGNDQQMFHIDEKSGLLSINNPAKLDAELYRTRRIPEIPFLDDNKRSITNKHWKNFMERYQEKEQVIEDSRYILTLVAKIVGTEPLEAYAQLRVRIADLNDNAPMFTQTQYSATVLEGNAKGDFVFKLLAEDVDQGLNSRLLYHIVDGNPDNAFIINPPYSGIVRTNIVLDREIREKYRLTIIATDQGNPQLTGTTALSIRVIDINDNQPTFPERKIISIPEDTSVGTVLTTITANDVDNSPSLTYRINDTDYTYLFKIDYYGGRVVLICKLDAEVKSEYILQIIASDGLHTATTELTIRVIDLNDNPPHFDQVAYIVNLCEERDNLLEVITVNAIDDDLTNDNNQINYRLFHSVKGFTVNPMSGLVLMNQTALTKPIPKDIQLTIIAEDSGKPSLKAMCSVVVNLNGLDNDTPGREYQVSIKENATKGTNLMKLSDVDLLNGIIVAGDDDGVFEISRGKLILANKLDRETKDRFVIRLSVRNGSYRTGLLMGKDSVTINITVIDVNDNYPHFLKDLEKVSIKEDVSLGYTVIILHAEDADLFGSESATVTYDISSGNDDKLFFVNSSSGSVMVNASLDCDLKPELHNLVIRACDSDLTRPLCAFTQLQVQIEDVNDNSPKFPVSEYLEFVGENEPVGSSIFKARAFDLDRGVYGQLNYSISSSAADGFSDIDDSWKLFSIDSKTGNVYTDAVFDYEQRNRYAFTIRATDTGGRSATVRVRIEIDSRDEFYPQFTERIYRFGLRISTQVMVGSVIGYVTATDRDKGPDGRVVYQLKAQHSLFKLNRTTGALIIKQTLSSGTNSEELVRLLISASSGRQGSLSNVTIVEVSWVEGQELGANRGATVYSSPTNVSTDMTMVTSSGLADWILGLLVVFLLLCGIFGSIWLYVHIRNLRHKKPAAKPALGGESNATASNSYVDPTAFETIAIRGVVGLGLGLGTNATPCGGLVNGGSVGTGASIGLSCQFAPPKYDEIPVYDTSAQSETHAASELSGSDQSGSSGRGSAEDEGDDEEIRMINEGQQAADSASDLSVHNTQEYLARLGIVDPPASASRSRLPDTLPFDSLHFFEDAVATEADIATLIYGKVGELRRPNSGLEVPGIPSMNGSLSSIVHSEEELTGSYNWDYLLDWGPQYQPLAHVFSEIARLKDDAASVQSGNTSSNGRPKSLRRALVPPPPPPPLLTCVAPRSLTTMATGLTRGILPRSPINHDASTFPSAALSPSFSPSLSPLATRSPSISPLVPDASPRTNQCSLRSVPLNDTELRI
ncbi:protein dachsous [Phymastichus coffea]|uniref:protein dachsous n=1 Tax=Phymastichus coffea TaxID=108790 RepID=UPI00273B7354|nr:protein dachsous [Phymastichus coffea]